MEENDDYEIPSRGGHTKRPRADEHLTALATAQGVAPVGANGVTTNSITNGACG
jgi:hypothetical protein